MSSPYRIERRDPASGVLKLGTVLSHARQERLSGQVAVRDRGRVHQIQLVGGVIAEVALETSDGTASGASWGGIQQLAERLFILPRPHVMFEPTTEPMAVSAAVVDPNAVVYSGVIRRQDLFDPKTLVERIPVNTVCLDQSKVSALRHLKLDPSELEFLERLCRPTPISMALWKRGLDPRRAGAILIALNLLGAWEDWRPGELPRLIAAVRIQRKIQQAAPDHELLNVAADASPTQVDRAFRRISLELHPDRLIGLPPSEVDRARSAFQTVSAAHQRLRPSRRQRPVAPSGDPLGRVKLVRKQVSKWSFLAEEARRAAAHGERSRARAFALKTIILSPPDNIAREMRALLGRVA